MARKHPRTRVVLLHNKKAGNGAQSLHEIEKLLRRHGYQAESYSLKPALKRTDPLDQGEFIVVAGGDGSVRRVATQLAHRRRPIAVLPTGTANNIATSLGIEGRPDEIVAGWSAGERRPIDLGVARGPWGRRRFVEGLGIGLLGRAIGALEEINAASAHEFCRKKDKLYRDLSVLLALAREVPPVPIGVTWDGTTRDGNFLLLEVLNINRAGPGVELARRADPSDGRLDLVTVTAGERQKLQDNLKSQLAERRRATVLTSRRVKTVRLSLHGGSLRIDDKIVWPRAPAPRPRRSEITVEISVDAGALEFVLPAKS